MLDARPLGIWCLALMAAAACGSAAIAAPKETPKPVARVTIAQGNVTADGAQGQRKLSLLSPVHNGDRVVVGNQGAAATLLLDSRVVLTLNAGTALRVIEQRGKTELRLERGQADVFVGQRPPDHGPVALVDPESVIETTGTIFLASYSPQTRTGVYACEEKAIKLSTRGGQSVSVPAGRQARVRGGAFAGLENFDRDMVRRQ